MLRFGPFDIGRCHVGAQVLAASCVVHSFWITQTYVWDQTEAPLEWLLSGLIIQLGAFEHRPQQGMFRFGPFDIGSVMYFGTDTLVPQGPNPSDTWQHVCDKASVSV